MVNSNLDVGFRVWDEFVGGSVVTGDVNVGALKVDVLVGNVVVVGSFCCTGTSVTATAAARLIEDFK